jgi:prepilin-type N-terminal cleavage/methylation domain-containing protein
MRLIARPATQRKQAGDTIVEVLIAIAVVGTILMGAYITTNSNTASTQDAQERTQALQVATSQVEYLRAAGSLSADCFNSAGQPASHVAGNDSCVVKSDGNQAPTGFQPAYSIDITGGNPYTVTVTWDSITGHGRNNVTLFYRTAK